MRTEAEMIIITALIRPNMEGHVVQALHDLPEFPGFYITEARGQGRGRGAGGHYWASESDLTYHHFLQLQVVCTTTEASRISDAIATAAWTGRKGDGVIFTSSAQSFVRIRETGRPSEEHHHD